MIPGEADVEVVVPTGDEQPPSRKTVISPSTARCMFVAYGPAGNEHVDGTYHREDCAALGAPVPSSPAARPPELLRLVPPPLDHWSRIEKAFAGNVQRWGLNEDQFHPYGNEPSYEKQPPVEKSEAEQTE